MEKPGSFVWICTAICLVFLITPTLYAQPEELGVKKSQLSFDSDNAINWPEFLHRCDMVWTRLPSGWDNGPFLGNGRLGTLFWQNNDGALNFEISRTDVYDHRDIIQASVLYSRYRLPNGHFELFSESKNLTGNLRLDLWNAEVRGQIRSEKNTWKIRCFTHAMENVIVLEVFGKQDHQLKWFPDSAKSTRNNPPKNYCAYPGQKQIKIGGINVSVQEMPADKKYNTEGRGMGQYTTAWTKVTKADTVSVYYISMGYSCPGTTAIKEACEAINRARKTGMARLEKTHREWWHTYYPKSFLSFPDAAMESFYWIQLYKMGSASRKGGTVLDLMGPWFRQTGWPAIWWNLNTQLAYWPFYMSNHLDEAEPLIESLWLQRDNLSRNAAPHQKDSYAIGRASAPDLVCPVGGEVGNLPWVMHNLWIHYRCTMDDAFLKHKLFPLMKGAFCYLLHMAVNHSDGTISLPQTASPEYTDAVENCNYTLACLRWLSSAIIAADERLQAKDTIVSQCKKILKHLVPYETDDSTGFMVGRNMPFVNSHRHWSHLFMIYPFHEYSWANPDQVPIIRKSLDNWLSRPNAFAGYSYLGAASILSSGGRGDEALIYLKTFLKRAPLPNTLYREGSPVIETPLAFARTIQELMMTSDGNMIRIFPGAPVSWSNINFADFRAEGAFLITAQRKNGVTSFVKIKSLAGELCHIATGINRSLTVSGEYQSFKDLGNGIAEIMISKGKTVVVYPGTELPAMDITPVDLPDVCSWGEQNPLR